MGYSHPLDPLVLQLHLVAVPEQRPVLPLPARRVAQATQVVECLMF